MYTEIRSLRNGIAQLEYRLVLTITPFTLSIAFSLIATAAVIVHLYLRTSAVVVDIGNGVGRLPCMILRHSVDDTRLTLSFTQSWATIVRNSHPIPFDRFLDVSIIAWNAYHVQSIISVILKVLIVWLGSATSMKQ